MSFSNRAAAPIFLLACAAAVRFLLAVHTTSSVASMVFTPSEHWFEFSDKHSITYACFRYLLHLAGADPVTGLFAFSAAVDTLTVIPLWLFVLRRGGSKTDAFFAALFFAVHPVLGRFGPSDSNYAPLMFLWASGLAALSVQSPGFWRVSLGLVFLGMAGTMRIEGPVYITASAPLLGTSALKGILRRPVAAALGASAAAALLAVQFTLKKHGWTVEIADYLTPVGAAGLVLEAVRNCAGMLVSEGLLEKWNGPIVTAFFLAGCAVAAASPGRRWGLWALVSLFLVSVINFKHTPSMMPMFLHRAVPGAMVQCVICGMAAGWLVEAVKDPGRRTAATALAAGVIAVSTPLSGLDTLRRMYEYNVEFRMVSALRAPSMHGGGDCALLWVRTSSDLGLTNPEAVLPTFNLIDCSDIKACLARAAEGGCVYWFRNAKCFEATGGDPSRPVPNGDCRRVEESLVMKAVEEKPVDLADYKMPRVAGAAAGIYRVSGVRGSP